MPEKPERTATDILKDLHEFISEPEEDFATLPMNKVEAVLNDSGINAKSAFQEVQDLFAKTRADEKLSKARQTQELFDRLLRAYRDRNPLGPAGAKGKDVLDRLTVFSPGQPASAFYKLEEATEEDLASLAEDLDLLEELKRSDAESDES